MGLSKLWGKDSSGAHGFVFSHIKAIYYNFSQNKLLSTKLDEMDAKDTETDNKIGNLSDLTTSVKSSVVAAITEVVSDMGDLSDLDSSVKTSLVAAINEALGNAQTAQNSVGTLSSLTTTAKGSAVAAINELNSNIETSLTAETLSSGSILDAVLAMGDNVHRIFVADPYFPPDNPKPNAELAIDIIKQYSSERILVVAWEYSGGYVCARQLFSGAWLGPWKSVNLTII